MLWRRSDQPTMRRNGEPNGNSDSNSNSNGKTTRFLRPSWQWRDWVGPAWTMLFALVAILDIWSCTSSSSLLSMSSPLLSFWLNFLHGGHHNVDNQTMTPATKAAAAAAAGINSSTQHHRQQHHNWNPFQMVMGVAARRMEGTSTHPHHVPADDRFAETVATTCPANGGGFGFDFGVQDENNGGGSVEDDMDYTAGFRLACAATSTLQSLLTWLLSTLHGWLSRHASWIGLIFCCLCVIESVRKALEARQLALDMAALDEFERKLARLYSATKRTNVFSFRPPQPASSSSSSSSRSRHRDNDDSDDDMAVTRKFIRVWTPVLSNLIGWCILLPWPAMMAVILFYGTHKTAPSQEGHTTFDGTFFQQQQYYDHGYGQCQDDPSLATQWISQSIGPLYNTWVFYQEQFISLLWKFAIPLHLLLKNPIGFIQRLQLVTRWVRYIRYGGPLLRLLFKLQDQIFVVTKTWRQRWTAQAEKDKRIARRSMLFHDLQRIESFAKFQTTIASLSSRQLFFSNQHMVIEEQDSMDSDGTIESISKNNSSNNSNRPVIPSWFAERKRDSQRLKRRLDHLRLEVQKSSRIFPSSEIYDRIVDLTQEVTVQVQSAFWNTHLISPQTRFSIAWRLVVTCTLLSELFRLYTSWQLSGSFDLRYKALFQHLLGLCRRRGRPVRNFIQRVLWLGRRQRRHRPWLDVVCEDSSPSARVVLQLASWSDVAIDVVGFLDIFVWFYTGELTATGVVVPKPFFYRCILPGTLIQILDHPTVPTVIPSLIVSTFHIARAVGYGRFIRWGWALLPAVELLVTSPVHRYLFKPMDHDEYLSYTGSALGGLMGKLSSRALMLPPSISGGTMITREPSYNWIVGERHWDDPTSLPPPNDDDDDDYHQGSARHLEHSITETDGYGLFYY